MDEVMRILKFQELKLLLIILTKKRYRNPILRKMAINQKTISNSIKRMLKMDGIIILK